MRMKVRKKKPVYLRGTLYSLNCCCYPFHKLYYLYVLPWSECMAVDEYIMPLCYKWIVGTLKLFFLYQHITKYTIIQHKKHLRSYALTNKNGFDSGISDIVYNTFHLSQLHSQSLISDISLCPKDSSYQESIFNI